VGSSPIASTKNSFTGHFGDGYPASRIRLRERSTRRELLDRARLSVGPSDPDDRISGRGRCDLTVGSGHPYDRNTRG
jgi:hypothetical protein